MIAYYVVQCLLEDMRQFPVASKDNHVGIVILDRLSDLIQRAGVEVGELLLRVRLEFLETEDTRCAEYSGQRRGLGVLYAELAAGRVSSAEQ